MRRTAVATSTLLSLALALSLVGGMELWGYSGSGGWTAAWSGARTDQYPTAKLGPRTVGIGLPDLTTAQMASVENAPLTESIRVGSILPITGGLGWLGPQMRDAADLAAEEINAAGVLAGSVELLHRDSQTNAAAAVDAASDLVLVEGVPVIIGAAASSVSLPVAGVTVPNQVVQVSPSATSPLFSTFEPEEPGWFWRTAPTDALQGKVAGLYAFNDKGWRDVAILARADPYGSGLAQAFQDTFVGLGGTITVRVDYNPDATSFTTELTTIFSSNPEAIWWVAFPGEGEIIMNEWWANTAWRAPAWLWAEGARSQTFVDTLVAAGIGVEGMEGTAPIGNGPNFETFRTAYLARYGREPQIFTAHTYDALYLTALAAAAGQGVDSVCIRNDLIAVANPPGTVVGPGPLEFERAVGILEAGGDIDYEGASGHVDFDLVGDVGSDYEIWSIGPAGQIQQAHVTPENGIWSGIADIPGRDITPPTLAISSPSAGALLPTAEVAVSWSASDAESGLDRFEVDLEGVAQVELQATASGYTFMGLADGSHTVAVTVIDAACNSRVASVDFTVDTTNPTIAIASPLGGATLALTSATISGTASDIVGIEKVELSTDATNWVLATGTTSWSGTLTLTEGPNTIYARATDTAGHTETVSIDVTVEIPSPGFQVSPTVLIVTGVLAGGAAAAVAVLWILGRRREGG